MAVCLQRAYEVVRMDSAAEYGATLEEVGPHHDETGSDELGNHVVNASDVDEYPHEQLVEPEPRDARAEEEDLRALCLGVCAVKDTDEAEPIVDEDGDCEGDPCREGGVACHCLRARVGHRHGRGCHSGGRAGGLWGDP